MCIPVSSLGDSGCAQGALNTKPRTPLPDLRKSTLPVKLQAPSTQVTTRALAFGFGASRATSDLGRRVAACMPRSCLACPDLASLRQLFSTQARTMNTGRRRPAISQALSAPLQRSRSSPLPQAVPRRISRTHVPALRARDLRTLAKSSGNNTRPRRRPRSPPASPRSISLSDAYFSKPELKTAKYAYNDRFLPAQAKQAYVAWYRNKSKNPPEYHFPRTQRLQCAQASPRAAPQNTRWFPHHIRNPLDRGLSREALVF